MTSPTSEDATTTLWRLFGQPVPARLQAAVTMGAQALTPGQSLLADPFGARRAFVDVRDTLEARLPELAATLSEELAAASAPPPGEAPTAHECLWVPTAPGEPDLPVHLVNMVYQCYCALSPGEDHSMDGTAPLARQAYEEFAASLALDEEDAEMQEDQEAAAAATALAASQEEPVVMTEAPDMDAAHPSLMSLRWLQRHCLPLGYHKNQVNTAIGFRFAVPWIASHYVFPPGRIFCTGASRRAVDATLLRYGTTTYLRAAGVRKLRVAQRVCQNLVANCHLPSPGGLCIGLLLARHRQYITRMKKFTGVKIQHPAMSTVTMLAFGKGRAVCVGGKRPSQVRRAYGLNIPALRAAYGTPENRALEASLIARRVIDRGDTPAPPAPPPDDPALPASRSARRHHQVRVLGTCV